MGSNMASRRVEPLTYGSLGKATYNTDTLRWEFQKLPQVKHRLHQISHPRILGDPILPPEDEDAGPDSRARYRRLKALLRDEPEADLLHSTVLGLSYTSEAIQRMPPDFNPNISDLLATGWGSPRDDNLNKFNYHFQDRKDAKERLRPFLASPGGVSGEALRIIGFEASGEVSEAAPPTKLSAHRLDLKSRVEWSDTTKTPIQQVCVSVPLNGASSYVAARRPSSTVIFKPYWKLYDTAGKQQVKWNASLLFEIPSTQTGGAEHIDVAFSPWRDDVAILDERGHWNMYGIEMSRYKRPYRLESSSAPRPGFENVASPLDIGIKCNGGWGRLVFAAQGFLLVVCSRRDWGVFTVGAPARRVRMPEMRLLGGDDIILDLKRDPSNPQMIFILTSSQLCWIHLAEGLVVTETTTAIDPKLILSWHHSWDSTTFVVRLVLSPAQHSGETIKEATRKSRGASTWAMIQGRGTRLLEVYEARYHPDSSRGVALGDPYLIHLRASDAGVVSTTTMAINLLLESIDITNSSMLINGHGSEGANPCYHQLIELDARLGISQTILQSSSSASPPPLISLDQLRPQDDLAQANAMSSQGKFPRGTFQAGIDHGAAKNDNFTRADSRSLGGRMYRDGLRDFAEQLNEAELSRRLKSIDAASLPSHGVTLLHDVVPSNLDIHDPEAASEILERYLQRLDGQESSELVVASVLTPHMRHLLTNQPGLLHRPSFSQIYDYMHRTWIAPLPSTITDRSKVILDKYARQVALEVFLCSVSLSPAVSASIARSLAPAEPEPLSSQRKDKGKGKGRDQIKDEFPDSVPASQPLGSLSQEEGRRPNYSPSASLARLLPTPTPPSLQDPTNVLARITDEWLVGADPAEYDWTRVRGVEGGALAPLQQLQQNADMAESGARGGRDRDRPHSQSAEASQATLLSSQRADGREAKKKVKRRKGF